MVGFINFFYLTNRNYNNMHTLQLSLTIAHKVSRVWGPGTHY